MKAFFFLKESLAWSIGDHILKKWAVSRLGSSESCKLTCCDLTYLNTAAAALRSKKTEPESRRRPASLSGTVYRRKMWFLEGILKEESRLFSNRFHRIQKETLKQTNQFRFFSTTFRNHVLVRWWLFSVAFSYLAFFVSEIFLHFHHISQDYTFVCPLFN